MSLNREMVVFLFAVFMALGPLRVFAEAPIHLRNDRFLVQIEKRGDAKFFRSTGDVTSHAWTVNCRTPLAGCVARQGALLLRLDDMMRPKLVTMTPIGARISIRERNLRQEVSNLFSAPLTMEQVERLSRKGSLVTVTLSEEVVLNARTEGIFEVTDFLIWMSSPENRTAGDARDWRFGSKFRKNTPEPTILDQYRFRAEMEHGPPKFTVPYTKPQIQFAIRAQQ